MSTLTNIQILRSAVPYKRPDPAFLLDGQLGINYKDEEPGLFTKLQSGDLVKFGPVAITTTGFAPNSSPDADGHPGNSCGEEWLDSRAALYRPIEHIYDGTNWLVTNGFEVDYNTGDFTLLKKLTVSALETDAAHIDGPLLVNGNITPNGTTCVHDLGTLSERWDGLFACQGDISGNLTIGGGLTLSQDLNIGGTLSVNQDLFVNGGATFGQTCGDGSKFTVKSPTFLNCDVEILGHTQGTDLTLSGDLVVEGDITLGFSCNETLTFKSKTIFECEAVFNQDITGNANLNIVTGKGYSLPTVATDPQNTLITKGFTEQLISSAALWTESGTTLAPVTPDIDVVPNGTADLGSLTKRWDKVYANDVYTGDLHMKNERGDWTLIEEEDCLTMTNNKTGKRYAISMAPYTG